jgi:tetratricopeptide (TPR) repeat protein
MELHRLVKRTIRPLLTHFGVAVVGVVLGVTFSYLMAQRIRRFLSEVIYVSAYDAYQAGKVEEAIFLLGQVAVEDPKLYGPWKLLGTIYLHEGKPDLALEMSEKALQMFDENGDPFVPASGQARSRALIAAQIDSLQKQMDDRRLHLQPK